MAAGRTIRVDAATRKAQADASNPRASAWVSANAGSGKTYVLARRVIRLLLAGTDPGRDPLPDLHQGGGGARWRRACSTNSRALDDALRRRPGARDRRGRGAPGGRRRPRPRPAPVRARPRDAGRPEDPDDPRLLRKAAAPVPVRGECRRAFRGARRARRQHPRRQRAPERPRRRCRPTPRDRSGWRSAIVLAAAGDMVNEDSVAEFVEKRDRLRAWITAAGSLEKALDRAADGARTGARRDGRRAPCGDRRRVCLHGRRYRAGWWTCLASGGNEDQKAARAPRALSRRERMPRSGSMPISHFWLTKDGEAARQPRHQSASKARWPGLDERLEAERARLDDAARPHRGRRLLRVERGDAPPRRCGDRGIRAAEDGARRPRLRGPDRQDRRPAPARRGVALGALQARPRPRPHPGRRGAGHQPAPVAGDRRAGRGILRRRRRSARRRGRSLPSATRSSRSSPSRARCRLVRAHADRPRGASPRRRAAPGPTRNSISRSARCRWSSRRSTRSSPAPAAHDGPVRRRRSADPQRAAPERIPAASSSGR